MALAQDLRHIQLHAAEGPHQGLLHRVIHVRGGEDDRRDLVLGDLRLQHGQTPAQKEGQQEPRAVFFPLDGDADILPCLLQKTRDRGSSALLRQLHGLLADGPDRGILRLVEYGGYIEDLPAAHRRKGHRLPGDSPRRGIDKAAPEPGPFIIDP